MTRLPSLLNRLRSNTSGLALIEFAFSLPVLVTLSLTGAELTNFITVKMRMSQIALQIADNAARMGTGTATQAKQVSITDINDVFMGAQIASGGMDLKANGRVVLSDVRTRTGGNYRIGWKYCYGDKTTYTAKYPRSDQDATNLTPGMGPSGREVTAQDSTPTMFVELYYVYKPIFSAKIAPTYDSTTKIAAVTEIASMSVRDRRDITGGTASNGIYNTASATVPSC